MPHKLRKIRKLRGSRTSGYGRVGQHRKSGGRGGVGRAGGHKHHWSWTVRYEPLRYRKIGFKRPIQSVIKPSSINIGELSDFLAEQPANQVDVSAQKPISIDLEERGFTKLLGRGSISQVIVVKISSYSKNALKKIEEAGGKIVESLDE